MTHQSKLRPETYDMQLLISPLARDILQQIREFEREGWERYGTLQRDLCVPENPELPPRVVFSQVMVLNKPGFREGGS